MPDGGCQSGQNSVPDPARSFNLLPPLDLKEATANCPSVPLLAFNPKAHIGNLLRASSPSSSLRSHCETRYVILSSPYGERRISFLQRYRPFAALRVTAFCSSPTGFRNSALVLRPSHFDLSFSLLGFRKPCVRFGPIWAFKIRKSSKITPFSAQGMGCKAVGTQEKLARPAWYLVGAHSGAPLIPLPEMMRADCSAAPRLRRASYGA